MQSRLILLVAAMAVCGLCGCAKMNEHFSQAGYGVAAEPLYGFTDEAITVPLEQDGKAAVWKYVNLSEAKCTKFVNGLVAAETGTDTLLDIESTLFSALSTAF